jgi:hypothetical protein
MLIPDLKIECLRCTASEILDPNAIQKNAEGEYKPINAKRPVEWLADPDAPFDPLQGICPKCAPDWIRFQEAFMTSIPSNPTVEVKEPFSIKAKSSRTISPTRVKEIPNSHIVQRNDEAPRVSSIPLMAPPVEPPQIAATADGIPVMRQLAGNRGVTVTPNRLMAPAPSGVRTTFSSIAVPAVRITPNGLSGAPTRISPKPVQTNIPATTMRKITPAPTRAVVGGIQHSSQPTMAMPNLPMGHVPHTGGGMVSVSAPVPIYVEPSTELPDGATMKGCVTISAPQPIVPK